MMEALLFQGLAILAFVAVIAGVPFLINFGRKYLNIKLTDSQAARLQVATTNAAQLAYKIVASRGASVADIAVVQSAIQEGVDYVKQHLPDIIKVFAKNDNDLTSMVDAKFGGLLVADPTVTITSNTATPVIVTTKGN